jgi:hypothetical protein
VRRAVALAAIEPTLDANGPAGRVVGPLESPNGAPCHAVDINLVVLFVVAVLLGGRDNELRQLVGLLEDGRERLTRRLRIARLRQRRLRRPERTQRGFDNGSAASSTVTVEGVFTRFGFVGFFFMTPAMPPQARAPRSFARSTSSAAHAQDLICTH